jgi:hypothetical protein
MKTTVGQKRNPESAFPVMARVSQLLRSFMGPRKPADDSPSLSPSSQGMHSTLANPCPTPSAGQTNKGESGVRTIQLALASGLLLLLLLRLVLNAIQRGHHIEIDFHRREKRCSAELPGHEWDRAGAQRGGKRVVRAERA